MKGLRARSGLFMLLTGAMLVLTTGHALAIGTGLGVAPATIELGQALRGSQHLRTIQVFSAASDPIECELSIEGEAAAWVGLYADAESSEPINRITVPGEGQAALTARFSIPDDASNGLHQATVVVRTAPSAGGESGQSSGASMVLRADVTVSIEVTGTQVLSGEVIDIVVRDTELNSPFVALVAFRNTGNVEAHPLVSVEIRKDDQLVQTIASDTTVIPPGELANAEVEADLVGVPEGDYVAVVTVSLDGAVLATKEIPFKVLPVGSLTREGNVISLTTEGQLITGRVLQVHAEFANTGQVPALAQLLVEVNRGGSLVGVEESRELRVMPNGQATLTAYVQLTEPGAYVLRCQVDYGGKLTDVQELSIDVLLAAPEPEPAGAVPVAAEAVPAASQPVLLGLTQQSVVLIAFAALAVLAVVLGGSLVLQRRRNGGARAPIE